MMPPQNLSGTRTEKCHTAIPINTHTKMLKAMSATDRAVATRTRSRGAGLSAGAVGNVGPSGRVHEIADRWASRWAGADACESSRLPAAAADGGAGWGACGFGGTAEPRAR